LTNTAIIVREFAESDAPLVKALFIKVNRLLASPELEDAFEAYIASSLLQEIDRIAEYYRERGGSFWVAVSGDTVTGMFGLEPSGAGAMELRRMYVDPDWRRRGIARMMLEYAESHCRAHNRKQLDLSTSEIQSEALSFYRDSGYEPVREEVAETSSNKTIGGGIRRFHFRKTL